MKCFARYIFNCDIASVNNFTSSGTRLSICFFKGLFTEQYYFIRLCSRNIF